MKAENKVKMKKEREAERRKGMIKREKSEAEVGKDLVLIYPLITYE